MVRWPRCAIALDRRRYQPPGNHALGLRVGSRLSRAVSHVPESSRFAWSNGVHRLGSRRDGEAPERLGRHLLGQKLGQSPPLRAKSEGQVPRSRASGPTDYWAAPKGRFVNLGISSAPRDPYGLWPNSKLLAHLRFESSSAHQVPVHPAHPTAPNRPEPGGPKPRMPCGHGGGVILSLSGGWTT